MRRFRVIDGLSGCLWADKVMASEPRSELHLTRSSLSGLRDLGLVC